MIDFPPNEEIFSAIITRWASRYTSTGNFCFSVVLECKRSFLPSRTLVFVDGRSWVFLILSWNSLVSICIFCTWRQLIKQLDIVKTSRAQSPTPCNLLRLISHTLSTITPYTFNMLAQWLQIILDILHNFTLINRLVLWWKHGNLLNWLISHGPLEVIRYSSSMAVSASAIENTWALWAATECKLLWPALNVIYFLILNCI